MEQDGIELGMGWTHIEKDIKDEVNENEVTNKKKIF